MWSSPTASDEHRGSLMIRNSLLKIFCSGKHAHQNEKHGHRYNVQYYAGLGTSWVPSLHSMTPKYHIWAFFIFEISRNYTNTGPYDLIKSTSSCPNGPSHWSDFLTRNPFVYNDNDELKLARAQNVMTIHQHEPFHACFLHSLYHITPDWWYLSKGSLWPSTIEQHTKGCSCFNVASITCRIGWRNIWRFWCQMLVSSACIDNYILREMWEVITYLCMQVIYLYFMPFSSLKWHKMS